MNKSHGKPQGRLAEEPKRQSASRRKVVVAILFAAAICGSLLLFREQLSLAYFAKQEALFRQYQADHPLVVLGAMFAVYVATTALSLPGATALTVLSGWLLPWWQAVVLVSFASTTGATLAFLMSRYLLRDLVQAKWGGWLEQINDALQRQGAFYLFTLRLVALIPFFVINVVMGVTPIRTVTFWWVSQLGMLPATLLYTYVGTAVPDLQTLSQHGARAVFAPSTVVQLFVAFALLGLFPWMAKWLIAKVRPKAIE